MHNLATAQEECFQMQLLRSSILCLVMPTCMSLRICLVSGASCNVAEMHLHFILALRAMHDQAAHYS